MTSSERAERARKHFMDVRSFCFDQPKDKWITSDDVFRAMPGMSYGECMRALMFMWFYGELERRSEGQKVFYLPIKRRIMANT